ncbi:MAG: alanine--tRNA ligase [Rhizobiaceae bacterium]|jgi:alanyl-tRNA synthetase|nr:alanine--tRNA ligase [Rhizobiaceae bacterium]
MVSVSDIRSTFLGYFERNGHEVVASSSLVPQNDPTLMFTNAGMVQFKNVFTGLEKRPYRRAATAQKCVRAGGKHNDLDNVGYTARHHTFFEMLGNFSFGDYFKEEAIHHAWTLVTKEYGLKPDKLLVTVYHTDDEAASLWKKIAGFEDHRIIRIPTSDNFWAMGDTGPCGPCSEIFIDQGEALQGGPPGSPDEDGDRFLEFWNLVFMQFEQVDADTRLALPKPSIDTGMGLERMSAILQGVTSNYDTDLFRTLIGASESVTGVKAQGAQRPSHRVIADHLRASAFLIADGVMPSNEGRGYVLRRIMRRAMRHAHLLGAREPVMWQLVPALTGAMGKAYPELLRAEALITEMLKLEETRFRATLERGLSLLDEATAGMGAGAKLAGETAFKLYDTYGFPLDLTQDALRLRGIEVDEAGFNSAMARQKQDARAAWAGSGDKASEAVWFGLADQHGATEFLGYTRLASEGVVMAVVKQGAAANAASAGEEVMLVANQTPFYAESGGQQGDAGTINGDGFVVEVTDTVKRAGRLHVHVGRVVSGSLKAGDAARFVVNAARRGHLAAHHSATHLLHEALRITLGEHVAQKGSLVSPDRLRFDFSQPRAISDEELGRIEDIANAVVRQNAPVVTRVMSVDDAIASGARALFGEKYGDEVRVVSMGDSDAGEGRFSVELCGGTHVAATGEIGLISIVAENAVASGVRRIEALAGDAARRHFRAQDERLRAIADLLKTTPQDAEARIAALVDANRQMERELKDARRQLALGGGGADGRADTHEVINGVSFLGRIVKGVEAKDLKPMADEAKARLVSGVAAFIAVDEEGKASVVVGVTADLTPSLNAVELVRLAAGVLGGKGGGGRPDMAQAGGPDGMKAELAIAQVRAALSV